MSKKRKKRNKTSNIVRAELAITVSQQMRDEFYKRFHWIKRKVLV